jgi:branched-chain amino acid aminotransferase
MEIEPEKKRNVCFLNGTIMPIEEAFVSPRDLGFLRGYSVSDAMPVVNGKPFLFEEHWRRLERSAGELDMRLRLAPDKAKEVIGHLIRRHEEYEAMTVRTILSGGMSESGLFPEGKETLCILVEESPSLPRKIYAEGGKIITLEFSRDMPSSKATAYIMPIRERNRKIKEGAVEILYVKDGEVLEASTSNFFVVGDGEIRTAKDGVLSGITRGLVIRLAGVEGFPVSEGTITEEELATCDEAFITASNKRVLPIVQVDDRVIGDGMPGPITRRLLSAYDAFIASY